MTFPAGSRAARESPGGSRGFSTLASTSSGNEAALGLSGYGSDGLANGGHGAIAGASKTTLPQEGKSSNRGFTGFGTEHGHAGRNSATLPLHLEPELARSCYLGLSSLLGKGLTLKPATRCSFK